MNFLVLSELIVCLDNDLESTFVSWDEVADDSVP